MSGLPTAVIDIDGVVADVTHRLHHLERPRKNWTAFFDAADQDPPLPEGLAVVRTCQSKGLEVHWLTGRPESLRTVTELWLQRHGLPTGPLTMRPGLSYQPARVLKRKKLDIIARTADIRVVIDDDPDVVSALRRAGYDVMHATWARQETDLLSEAQETEGRT